MAPRLVCFLSDGGELLWFARMLLKLLVGGSVNVPDDYDYSPCVCLICFAFGVPRKILVYILRDSFLF